MSDFYPDDCKPLARVYVDGEELPTINEGVETKARIDGPMDINLLTEAYFPVEWKGNDITAKIEAYDPSDDARGVWQPVDVQFIDPTTIDDDEPEYVTYHRGFPMGYGPGSKGTLERKLRVGDVGQLLDGIPFTGSYDYDATIGDVLKDVVDEFESHQDLFTIAEITKIDRVLDEDTYERYNPDLSGEIRVLDIVDWATTPILEPIGDFFGATTTKSFKSNEHTLRDVIDYITKKISGELYFIPYGDDQSQISLVYDENRERDFYANNTDEDNNLPSPTVIKNNALYEIQPINTIEVNGKPDRSVFDNIDIIDGDTTYPSAKATHEPLKRLAGQEYKRPTGPVDTVNPEDTEKKAVEKLIDQIEGGGTGEIATRLFPYIYPHDNIFTKPACGHNVESNVPAISYTVNEVVHKVGYDHDCRSFFQKTHLRVNTHVSQEDITVTSEVNEL